MTFGEYVEEDMTGQTVTYSIDVRGAGITSLKGAPDYAEQAFICGKNKLKNLVGAPSYVVANANFSFNQLTSLEGCPKHVGSTLNLEGNTKLKSLKGMNVEFIQTLDLTNTGFKSDEEIVKEIIKYKININRVETDNGEFMVKDAIKKYKIGSFRNFLDI